MERLQRRQEVNRRREDRHLEHERDLREELIRKERHQRREDQRAKNENRPATSPDGAAVYVSTQKSDSEHQIDHTSHAVGLHVIRQKDAVDVRYLRRGDLRIFQVSIVLKKICAQFVRDALAPLAQIVDIPTDTIADRYAAAIRRRRATGETVKLSEIIQQTLRGNNESESAAA